MLLDDLLAHGQPQPGSQASRLGGEEGIQRPPAGLLRHAATIVLEREEYTVPVRGGAHDDRSVFSVDGVRGIDQEVDRHLRQPAGGSVHDRHIAAQVGGDPDSPEAWIEAQELDRRLDGRIDAHRLPFHRHRAREITELLDDGVQAVELVGDHLQALPILRQVPRTRLLCEAFVQLLADRQNRVKRVPDLVCNARRQGPEREHLLCLEETMARVLDLLRSLDEGAGHRAYGLGQLADLVLALEVGTPLVIAFGDPAGAILQAPHVT